MLKYVSLYMSLIFKIIAPILLLKLLSIAMYVVWITLLSKLNTISLTEKPFGSNWFSVIRRRNGVMYLNFKSAYDM